MPHCFPYLVNKFMQEQEIEKIQKKRRKVLETVTKKKLTVRRTLFKNACS